MRTHRYSWALAIALLASCADYSVPDNVLYGEAVYTQPAPGFDFKTLDSYFLDPVVKVFEDDPLLPTTIDLRDAQYTGIVNAVDTNMQALGYTKLTTIPVPPVAGATVVRMAIAKGTGTYWYGGYWCDPYYYYYCGYDWYYAGSYKYGTVMMSLNDFSVPPGGTTNLPIRWIAAMYGVASTPAYDIPRITDAVNRAYGQSAYLDTH